MIKVLNYRAKNPVGAHVINVTSHGTEAASFSPFNLGPCELTFIFPGGKIQQVRFRCMENAWQYSKVYKCHIDANGEVKPEWFEWMLSGSAKTADRYPMGRGAKPEFSLFYEDGFNKKLSYVDARKKIYIPLYRNCVERNPDYLAFKNQCIAMMNRGTIIVFKDFDGYETADSYETIVNNPNRKCGHAFILKNMIEN